MTMVSALTDTSTVQSRSRRRGKGGAVALERPLEVGRARPLSDRRELKLLLQQMSRAFRDSQGGGLMERFEAISKLLFTRIVDEREVAGTWKRPIPKREPQLRSSPVESDRTVYERAREVWQRAVGDYPQVFARPRAMFPSDVQAVARIVRLLEPFQLSQTRDDIKGGAYEELLRNTFEKNENQQYFTPRQIVDFMVRLTAPRPNHAVCDPASGSGGFLVGALASVAEVDHRDVRQFSSRMRGAEVDERMAWVARINMLMHGGDPTTVFHVRGSGSLAPLTELEDVLPAHSFDIILTNPPFGSDLNDQEALQAFVTGRGRSSRRRGILFIERCLELLKPGGRLAIVIDDSSLNLVANRDLQELVRERAIVEAVVSLPDVTFMPYSTAKSSILLLRRRAKEHEPQSSVFMADVENVGVRPNGDALYSDDLDEHGRRKLKTDLPRVLELFKRWTNGEDPSETFEGTSVFTADIAAHKREPDGSRLDVFYFHPLREIAEQQLARSRYPLMPLEKLAVLDSKAVTPSDEFADGTVRWIGLAEIESNTGVFDVKEVPGERIRSNAHIFRAGDLLLSRLRPKLRKAIEIPDDEEGGVCSAELVVLRAREDYASPVFRKYLAYLLRSDLVFGQLIFRVTGVGRPRVSSETISRLQIPLPAPPVQEAIVRTLVDADQRAADRRAAAHRELQLAGDEMARAFATVLIDLFHEPLVAQERAAAQPRQESVSAGAL